MGSKSDGEEEQGYVSSSEHLLVVNPYSAREAGTPRCNSTSVLEETLLEHEISNQQSFTIFAGIGGNEEEPGSTENLEEEEEEEEDASEAQLVRTQYSGSSLDDEEGYEHAD